MYKAISYILFKQGILSGHKNMDKIGMVSEQNKSRQFSTEKKILLKKSAFFA
jgi:hypothetical protein